MIIDDGTGSGNSAKVDANNRLHVQSNQETEELQAASEGEAYNINSGSITFSAAGTLIYLKNNENRDIVVAAVAVGVGTGATSDNGEITIVRNPTGGDLITDATAVAMRQNRNFGSAKTLTADAYAGKSAGTVTGGDDILLLYHGTDARLYAPINLVLPKGQSMAIEFDPKLSSGTVKAYGAVIIYLKDPENV